MTYKVVSARDRLEVHPGAIPTPLLVQEGYEHEVEAYYKPTESAYADGRRGTPGVWYLRDDRHGYTAPTGEEYRRVMVVLA